MTDDDRRNAQEQRDRTGETFLPGVTTNHGADKDKICVNCGHPKSHHREGVTTECLHGFAICGKDPICGCGRFEGGATEDEETDEEETNDGTHKTIVCPECGETIDHVNKNIPHFRIDKWRMGQDGIFRKDTQSEIEEAEGLLGDTQYTCPDCGGVVADDEEQLIKIFDGPSPKYIIWNVTDGIRDHGPSLKSNRRTAQQIQSPRILQDRIGGADRPRPSDIQDTEGRLDNEWVR